MQSILSLTDKLMETVLPRKSAGADTCYFSRTRCVTGGASSGCASTNHRWTQNVYQCESGRQILEFAHCGC